MEQKIHALTRAESTLIMPAMLDSMTAERVVQWIKRWHGADYDIDHITHLIKDWPTGVPLTSLVQPFNETSESESAESLAHLVFALIRYVERGWIQTSQARGTYRFACRQLCTRGIPFEETAKGDETALWFHFIAMNEFGDVENQGYATDFSELRLMARYLVDRHQLLRDLLEGEMPATFQEGYVSIAGAIGDRRLTPHLLRILRRSEDVSEVAQTINVLGRLGDSTVVPALEGYALSANDEISTVAVLAIEALGGSESETILHRVENVVAGAESALTAHVELARLHLREGADALHTELMRVAADEAAPKVNRLAAIERLSATTNPETIHLLASLLDDPTFERVNVDGLYTDDVVYTIREAAYLALNDRRISALVQVLGEDILDQLESFQMYTMPSWWNTFEIDPEIPEEGM